MKLFIDSGNLKEIENLVPLGIIDGDHDEPVAARQGRRRLQGDPEEDLPDREGPDERRGRRHRRRRHDPRRARPGRDRRAHRRQGAVHEGRREGLQDALVGRPARERDAHLLADAGAAGGQGRRDLRQPVRRPARRHRDLRHAPRFRRSSRSSRTTSSRPRSSSPRCVTTSTSSRRRAWAPTSAPARPAVIEGMFKHPLTDIGLERFLKDWEKAQAARVRSG